MKRDIVYSATSLYNNDGCSSETMKGEDNDVIYVQCQERAKKKKKSQSRIFHLLKRSLKMKLK